MNATIGKETLKSHGFYFDEYFFWISFGALLGIALVWNIGFTLALSFLKRRFIFILFSFPFCFIVAQEEEKYMVIHFHSFKHIQPLDLLELLFHMNGFPK